jgi:predicted amidohydrolase
MLKIGYYQFRPLFGQVNKNVSKVINALRGAEADLIVIPELPFTGYYFRDRGELKSLAEDPSRQRAAAGSGGNCAYLPENSFVQ